MGATTRWKDTENTDLSVVLSKMTSNIPDDDRGSSVYRIGFRNRTLSENSKFMELNGQKVEYNVVKYTYTQVTPQVDPTEDREIPQNGFIVVVKSKGIIYYIIDQNSSAKKLLRKLLNYTGRNEIEKANFDFEEDFFVWLVSRVYNSNCLIENNNSDINSKELVLEEIKGIRGNTEDLQTKVATSGETVMNVISTLSFLLESRRLDQVILNIRYTKHDDIGIKLQKSTVEWNNSYIGEFKEPTNEEQLGKIYLLLYFEILPLLEQEYRLNIDNDEWNRNIYIDFLKKIKEAIIEKIEDKINAISA